MFSCIAFVVKVPSPSDLRVTNFSGTDISVRWESAADDVVSYFIKWISLSGGELRQVCGRSPAGTNILLSCSRDVNILVCFQLRVSGDSEGALLEGVQDDNEYQISLSALYGDGAQSEAVAIRYSTRESHT